MDGARLLHLEQLETGHRIELLPGSDQRRRGRGRSLLPDGSIAWYGGAVNSGSFSNVYINSKWAFNVSGLYQLPLNFNVAANLYGRQGYPLPYYVQVNPGDSLGARNVLVGNPDKNRNSDLYELDMRLEKVVPLFQKADLTFSLDVFNVMNSNTVLQKQVVASTDSSGRPTAATRPPTRSSRSRPRAPFGSERGSPSRVSLRSFLAPPERSGGAFLRPAGFRAGLRVGFANLKCPR